jgi:hypothetical protein
MSLVNNFSCRRCAQRNYPWRSVQHSNPADGEVNVARHQMQVRKTPTNSIAAISISYSTKNDKQDTCDTGFRMRRSQQTTGAKPGVQEVWIRQRWQRAAWGLELLRLPNVR